VIREKLKFQKLVKDIPSPNYMTAGAAGFDLFIARDTKLYINTPTKVSLGVVVDIPAGCFGLMQPRGSLYHKFGISCSDLGGVIDSDYCGPKDILYTELLWSGWKLVEWGETGNSDMLNNFTGTDAKGKFFKLKKGWRVVQMVILPLFNAT